MIRLSRIILSLGRWTSKTLSVHFFARRMPTPFVPSELPDQKTLSFPFNHRTWERDWDGHSTPFHLVSWRKPQSSLLLVAVSTISALRPLIVPTFILPVRNSSSFGVWFLFFPGAHIIRLDGRIVPDRAFQHNPDRDQLRQGCWYRP